MSKLIIDADIFCFRAAAAAERVVEWAPDRFSLDSDLREARDRLNDAVADTTNRLGVDGGIVMAFTSGRNWRKVENPDYKSNRKGNRKPLAFLPLMEWCLANMTVRVVDGLEADDLMGIEATTPGNDVILVSEDKDFLTIPGAHFNPAKDLHVREVTEEEADYALFTQALTGDSTDGYPGCPGVGAKTAPKILDPVWPDREAAWAAIVGAYTKKKLTEADAVMNARMARICRHGDWNPETKEMTWAPV